MVNHAASRMEFLLLDFEIKSLQSFWRRAASVCQRSGKTGRPSTRANSHKQTPRTSRKPLITAKDESDRFAELSSELTSRYCCEANHQELLSIWVKESGKLGGYGLDEIHVHVNNPPERAGSHWYYGDKKRRVCGAIERTSRRYCY